MKTNRTVQTISGKIFLLVFVLVVFGSIFLAYKKPSEQNIKLQSQFKNFSSGKQLSCIYNTEPSMGQIKPKEHAGQLVVLQDSTQTITNEVRTNPNKNPQELVDLASKRLQAFSYVMEKAPAAAVTYLLEEDVRNYLNLISKNCTEKEITLSGTLGILHADYFLRGSSYNQYILTSPVSRASQTSGTEEWYVYPETAITYPTGSSINIQGYSVGQKIASLQETLTTLKPQDQSTEKKKEISMILAVFAGDIIPNEYSDPAQAESSIAAINDYYQENSYKKLSIGGQVFGPYVMSIERTCDLRKIATAAIKASDKTINFRKFTSLTVVAPTYCQWAGLATLNPIPFVTNEGTIVFPVSIIDTDSNVSYSVLAHEYGHNLGIGHAGSYVCDQTLFNQENPQSNNPCFEPQIPTTEEISLKTLDELVPDYIFFQEYGDFYSVMGRYKSFGHFNALHKELMGWFDAESLVKVNKSGRYELIPIEKNERGAKALRIHRKLGKFLYVEYRQPIGYDQNLANYYDKNTFDGALIHSSHIYPFWPESLLLDMTSPADNEDVLLTPGKPFTDPASKVTIEVVSATPEKLTVDVRF